MASIMEAEDRHGAMADDTAGGSYPPFDAATADGRIVLFALEGNIGVGKSTIMEALKERYADDRNVAFVDEPVKEWEERGFLKRMYDEPASRPAFQHMVLMSLAGDLLKTVARKPRPRIVITERSPWGNYHVFGKANLTGNDLKMYEYTWEHVTAGLPSELHLKVLWLDASVETAQARMQGRDRAAEGGVPVEYLQTLQRLHEAWLDTDMDMSRPVRVRIDANRTHEEVLQEVCDAVHVLSMT